MRPQKVSDLQLTEEMLKVLRDKGYEGSSLNELATVGGLKKASLYHRFPDGKEQLAQSVLDSYSDYLQKNVFDILQKKKLKPKKRLKSALDSINSLYAAGSANCLYQALAMGPGYDLFGKQIAGSCKQWVKSFSRLGKDLGFKKKKAGHLAWEGLLKIQGSLVLSRVFDDPQLFQDVVKEIKGNYTN